MPRPCATRPLATPVLDGKSPPRPHAAATDQPSHRAAPERASAVAQVHGEARRGRWSLNHRGPHPEYATTASRTSAADGPGDRRATQRREPPHQPPNSSASATFSPARVRLLCSQVLEAELLGRDCFKDHALGLDGRPLGPLRAAGQRLRPPAPRSAQQGRVCASGPSGRPRWSMASIVVVCLWRVAAHRGLFGSLECVVWACCPKKV